MDSIRSRGPDAEPQEAAQEAATIVVDYFWTNDWVHFITRWFHLLFIKPNAHHMQEKCTCACKNKCTCRWKNKCTCIHLWRETANAQFNAHLQIVPRSETHLGGRPYCNSGVGNNSRPQSVERCSGTLALLSSPLSPEPPFFVICLHTLQKSTKIVRKTGL